jgi:phenylacetic acid degradation operon negative regulatory protein
VKFVDGLRLQSLVITLYGDYIRHAGGCIWIGSLIELLSHFGVSQQAIRSTISRMKRNATLRVDRVGSRSYYSLTNKSAKFIEAGAARIFQFPTPREKWNGAWHLVTYSVPENERAARDRLRQELEWLGYGMLTNALWIAPFDHRDEIAQLSATLGVRTRIEMFTARHDGFSEFKNIVARCWDLPALNARYIAFIKKYKPMYETHCRILQEGKDLKPSDYFVRRFMLIHEFRKFPYLDPQLPPELLPTDWRGDEAVKLFKQYHDLLANKANEFFYSIYNQVPQQCDV